IIVGLILASSFAIRWPFRQVPLIRDEGEYAYLGQQILHGAIPYRDVYNQKTPFAFYFFAAIQVAFGSSLEALRVATTLYGLATPAILYLFARGLFNRRAALGTAVAFAVMTFDECGVFAQSSTEYYLLLWMSLGLLCWYEGKRRGSNLLVFCA